MRACLSDGDPGGGAAGGIGTAFEHGTIQRVAISEAKVGDRDSLEKEPAVIDLADLAGIESIGCQDDVHDELVAHSLQWRTEHIVNLEGTLDSR